MGAKAGNEGLVMEIGSLKTVKAGAFPAISQLAKRRYWYDDRTNGRSRVSAEFCYTWVISFHFLV
jgi:hypothetical protein